jgi:hypothetical protein
MHQQAQGHLHCSTHKQSEGEGGRGEVTTHHSTGTWEGEEPQRRRMPPRCLPWRQTLQEDTTRPDPVGERTDPAMEAVDPIVEALDRS